MGQEKVCLDTDVVIEITRNNKIAIDFLKELEGVPVLTSISIFELLRVQKTEAAEKFIQKCEVIDFDESAARHAAKIELKLRQKGKMTPLRDLMIASIALSNNMQLATFNKKDFEQIEGLKLI